MRTRTIEYLDRGHIMFVLLLMAQFQFWDSIMTYVFASKGLAKEANQLVAPFISSGTFLFIRLLGIAAMIALLWLLAKRFPRIAMTAASCVALFYIFVITWNFLVFFRSY